TKATTWTSTGRARSRRSSRSRRTSTPPTGEGRSGSTVSGFGAGPPGATSMAPRMPRGSVERFGMVYATRCMVGRIPLVPQIRGGAMIPDIGPARLSALAPAPLRPVRPAVLANCRSRIRVAAGDAWLVLPGSVGSVMSVFVPTMRAAPHGPARIYLGNLAEWYDFATFGASAALLSVVVTAGRGGLTSVFVVLAGALLIRPVGSVLVGHFSDRAGRRLPFLVMTLSTCVATAAVGLLPSAANAGLFAVV